MDATALPDAEIWAYLTRGAVSQMEFRLSLGFYDIRAQIYKNNRPALLLLEGQECQATEYRCVITVMGCRPPAVFHRKKTTGRAQISNREQLRQSLGPSPSTTPGREHTAVLNAELMH